MCTVSFYKDSEKIVLTSNRDEKTERALAIAPQTIVIEGKKYYYPIDPQANGSWYGVTQGGSILVLLNGAEKKHISKPPYHKSRGLIFLDILKATNFLQIWKEINLLNIEPFTLIAYEKEALFQLVWNGIEKKYFDLDSSTAHIWSSSTLYEEKVILIRKNWFLDFLELKNNQLESSDFIHFHKNTETNNLENGLVINRNGKMQTKNITQCTLFKNSFKLLHQDLILNKETIIVEKLVG
jgi:uncharacterized protein with NRDE domain